eukprot:853757-Prymnesium_polylepis.1
MQSMLSDSFVVLQLMVAQFLLRVSYPHCCVTARDPYRVRVYDYRLIVPFCPRAIAPRRSPGGAKRLNAESRATVTITNRVQRRKYVHR